MINTSLIEARAILARQQLLHQKQEKRLARRIHDDICQQLTLLSLQLSMATLDSKPPANWTQNCKQWSAMVLELGQNLRNIMNELQPRVLDDTGLGAALQWYVQSRPNGVECRLLLPEQPAFLPVSAANELFAICRDIVGEVLAPNAVTEAIIAVDQTPELLRLHLRVNEKNLSLAPLASKALDALSIHERMFCIEGSLEIEESPAKELVITLSVPVNRPSVSQAA